MIRRLWVKKWAADYVHDQLGILGCRALLRLDTGIRHAGEIPSSEARYFVSSLDLDEAPASEFQELIRRHWEAENCLHWQKDRYFEGDNTFRAAVRWARRRQYRRIAESIALEGRANSARSSRKMPCRPSPHRQTARAKKINLLPACSIDTGL